MYSDQGLKLLAQNEIKKALAMAEAGEVPSLESNQIRFLYCKLMCKSKPDYNDVHFIPYLSKFSSTFRYCAPEMAEADFTKQVVSATTYKFDVWSLGLTLWLLYNQGKELPWKEKGNDKINAFEGILEAHHSGWFPEPADRDSVLHLIWEMLQDGVQGAVEQ